ncbi:MAG: PQQ-binding-like beta-propeller repeat protein, partial [Akkermansiaceae bacterium]|nr:PQQ-binding-like beta-propeller repeat protein [Akkermansiaceae bacterium]
AASVAEQIVRHSGLQKGYCLVLDSGDGRLAFEIARRTEMRVIGIESNPAMVARSRERLKSAGLYGSRVAIHHMPAGGVLPYQDYTMNLVVCERLLTEGKLPTASAAAVSRVLRPHGGEVALVASDRLSAGRLDSWAREALPAWKVETRDGLLWGVARRETLPGAGQWSHQYADPANTACSGDALVEGALEIQWWGRPGPRKMVDRHQRTSSPVLAGGTLYMSGLNKIIAADAYNGTVLWERAVPDSLRLFVSKDCSNMAAAEDVLYVASGKQCLALDSRTGQVGREFRIGTFDDGVSRQWGYVAWTEDVLFGSAVREEEARRRLTPDSWQFGYLDNARLVCSDELYGFDRHRGEQLWARRSDNGVFINSAI